MILAIYGKHVNIAEVGLTFIMKKGEALQTFIS